MSTLDNYLKESKNSVFREKLVNYKFFYDVKLASARMRSDINIYIPEVDRDGYDVILDDGNKIKPFQLKAVNKSSSTSRWDIQRNLLRPNPMNASILGFEESPQGEGSEGGFILVNIIVNEDTIDKFEYFYTDIFILKAFELGIIKYNNKTYQDKIIDFLKALYNGKRNEKITLTKSKLIKVKSVDSLLALADLSSIKHNQWQAIFLKFLKNKDDKLIRIELIKLLKALIDDKAITVV